MSSDQPHLSLSKLTLTTVMLHSRFNAALATQRHATLAGVYDTHTNLMFYPQIMQPTHARWEQLSPPNNHIPIYRKSTNP